MIKLTKLFKTTSKKTSNNLVRLPKSVVASKAANSSFKDNFNGLSMLATKVFIILIKASQTHYSTNKPGDIHNITTKEIKSNFPKNYTNEDIYSVLQELEEKNKIIINERAEKNDNIMTFSLVNKKLGTIRKEHGVFVLDISKITRVKSLLGLFLTFNALYRPNDPSRFNRTTIYSVLGMNTTTMKDRMISKERIMNTLKSLDLGYIYSNYTFTFSFNKKTITETVSKIKNTFKKAVDCTISTMFEISDNDLKTNEKTKEKESLDIDFNDFLEDDLYF